MPDGAQVQFPDDMPNEQIKGMIASKYPDAVKQFQPSIMQQINSNIDATHAESAASGERYRAGQQGLPETIAQGFAQTVNLGGDVVAPVLGAGLKAAYNGLTDQSQRDKINAGISDIANSDIGKATTGALKKVGDYWDYTKQTDPAGAANLSALGTALTMGLGGRATKEVADSGLVKGLGNALEDYAPKIITPESPLSPLANASASLVSKTPNELTKGLEVNQAISANYKDAKKTVSRLYKEVQNQGNFEVPAPDLYNKLSDINSYLEDKVAPTGKDAGAYRELKRIQSNLEDKYGIAAKSEKVSPILDASGNPIVKAAATQAVPANTVSANDLVSLEKAMNQALPAIGKSLASGDLSLVNFKNEIGNHIAQAADINPKFGDAYKNAEDVYGNMASIYYNPESKIKKTNPQLAPIWRLQDSNPIQNGQIPSAMQSRAQKTLTYLNTEDTGKISAVLNALPQEQRQSLMDAALANSKKNKVSIGSALMQLVKNPRNPSYGASTALRTLTTGGGETPLEKGVGIAKGATPKKQITNIYN